MFWVDFDGTSLTPVVVLCIILKKLVSKIERSKVEVIDEKKWTSGKGGWRRGRRVAP